MAPTAVSSTTRPSLSPRCLPLSIRSRSCGGLGAWSRRRSWDTAWRICRGDACGVFSLEDGLKLIAARAFLMSALPREGAMVAVFVEEATVRSALHGLEHSVSVAAANGPTNTVISGAVEGIETVLSRLAPRGVEFQRLNVSHAFHSPLMEPMLDEFESVAASIKLSAPTVLLMSNLTGRQAAQEVTKPNYWRRHVSQAVRFGNSIAALLEDGYRLFLEVGPASTLIGMAQRCAGSDAAAWISSLRKGRNDRVSMLQSLGHLHVRGQRIAWPAVLGGTPMARPFDLPTYAFQRRHFWIERQVAADTTRLSRVRSGHPLLGGVVDSPLHIFQSEIGIYSHPWLADHRIFDLTPFPATGFLELALACIREVRGSAPGGALREVTIREGLMLPESGLVTVQVVVTPADGGNHTVQVFSRVATEGDEVPSWRLHMSATHVAAGVEGVITRDFPAFSGLSRSPRRRTTKSSERRVRPTAPRFRSFAASTPAGSKSSVTSSCLKRSRRTLLCSSSIRLCSMRRFSSSAWFCPAGVTRLALATCTCPLASSAIPCASRARDPHAATHVWTSSRTAQICCEQS